MSYENFPDPEPQRPTPPQTPVRRQDYRTVMTVGLLVALLGTWAYIIYDKNKTKEEKIALTTEVTTADSSKNEIQGELNEALGRLDDLKTTNARADSLLRTKDKEVEGLRNRVQAILSNKNATEAELKEARGLISQLKDNISTYTTEIQKLQGEKIKLTEEKRAVTEERDVVTKNYDSAQKVIKEKEDVIDVGSTLHASNFNIVGLQEKGSKEKETSKAKRVDKLRITFDLDENLIAQTGPKDVFIAITAPDGNPVAVEALGSGKFLTRDGAEKIFTKKMQVNYKKGEKQTVSVEWKQNTDFQIGNYKIEVYNNGFKIGEGVRNFRKAGIF